MVGLSADQLADNLTSTNTKHKPKCLEEAPETVANDFLQKDNVLVCETLAILKNLCKFLALELFYQPVVRMKVHFKSNSAYSTFINSHAFTLSPLRKEKCIWTSIRPTFRSKGYKKEKSINSMMKLGFQSRSRKKKEILQSSSSSLGKMKITF